MFFFKLNLVNDQCRLCDDIHPNADMDFTHCRKFLQMSPRKRCEHVWKKKLCLQCLDGKTRWNDLTHDCCDKWICQHEAHVKYEKKLHFLLCEYHIEDERNKKLFNDFRKEVLKADWQQKLFKNPSSYHARDSVYVERRSMKNDANLDSTDELQDATNFGTPVFLLQPFPFNNHFHSI